ncbi:MAG TPA: hypothetical protein VJ721_04970 [Chthoniobacterales bacterium]|nr:hypothetical protein [Chthoniobacterales bacterium]
MWRILMTLLALAIVVSADAGQVRIFAGARFDSKAWAKLQKFDVTTLSKDRALDANVGRLVELHFQFRSKELRHLKPNWYQASVWEAAPEGRRGFVSVPVMIANTDLKAFESFTTDHRSAADLKLYGQVLYDFGINYVFIRVIGINAFVDADGITNVTW